jgi:GT2 family glycosyltransferase
VSGHGEAKARVPRVGANAPASAAAGATAPAGESAPAAESARASGPPSAVALSCVILTMGDRPAELDRAVRSVLDQAGAAIETVVVANGAQLTPLPQQVRSVLLPSNVGIPAGRNAGVAECTGDVILFLDDDGWYVSRDLAAHVRGRFAADPSLAVLSFHVRDPAGGPGQRRHVPRLRAGDPERSSAVTTFLGGACAIRREAFARAGGYPGGFFYAHEETDLAWRLMDAGYRLEYDAAAVMFHPAVLPRRHAQFYQLNARNRVLLARRNLPWPVAAAYLFDWALMMLVRERSLRALRPWFAGFTEGWRADPGERRPISWRTIWRMTVLGRPPVI